MMAATPCFRLSSYPQIDFPMGQAARTTTDVALEIQYSLLRLLQSPGGKSNLCGCAL